MSAQDYNSAMGLRVGNGYQWTGKIFLGEKSALTGFVGITNVINKDTRAGASMLYQRHHRIFDEDNIFFFYGYGIIGEFGDQGGIGSGPSLGLSMNLWKKLNVELDIFPTYYLSDELDYYTNFGISLRYIASHN